jgi:hypothetical protein
VGTKAEQRSRLRGRRKFFFLQWKGKGRGQAVRSINTEKPKSKCPFEFLMVPEVVFSTLVLSIIPKPSG